MSWLIGVTDSGVSQLLRRVLPMVCTMYHTIVVHGASRLLAWQASASNIKRESGRTHPGLWGDSDLRVTAE